MSQKQKAPSDEGASKYRPIWNFSINRYCPNICDGIYVLIEGTNSKIINAATDRKKNGKMPENILSNVISLPSGIWTATDLTV